MCFSFETVIGNLFTYAGYNVKINFIKNTILTYNNNILMDSDNRVINLTLRGSHN
jgi:hypothetical protein